MVSGSIQDVQGRLHSDVVLERYRYLPGPAGVTPSHSHPEYQLCLGVGTATRYRYRGAWHVVPSGSLCVLMPDEIHETMEAEDRAEAVGYRVLYAGPSRLAMVAAEIGGRRAGLPFFADAVLYDHTLIERFRLLHAVCFGPSSRLHQDVLLLSVLAIAIAGHARTRTMGDALTGPRRAIRLARAYLEDNYAANVSLDELATVAELSPFHLARLFRREIGMPPHAYQIQVRIDRAKRLLLRGHPVSRVASETGFFDLSHFTRHFKRHMGVAPGQYIFDGKNVHYPRA
jgi:AraC-like DNA-binding protein